MVFTINNDGVYGRLFITFNEGEILIREPDVRDLVQGKFEQVSSYMPGETIIPGNFWGSKILHFFEGFKIGALHSAYGEDSQLLKEEAAEDGASLVLKMHYIGKIVEVDLNDVPTGKILVRPGGFFAAAANATHFGLETPQNAALNSLFSGAYGTKEGVSFQAFDLPEDGIVDVNTGRIFIEAVGAAERYEITKDTEFKCEPSKLLAMTSNVKLAPSGDAEYNAGIVDKGWYRLQMVVDEDAEEDIGYVWLDAGYKLVKS